MCSGGLQKLSFIPLQNVSYSREETVAWDMVNIQQIFIIMSECMERLVLYEV
jgi:hypothetical protein